MPLVNDANPRNQSAPNAFENDVDLGIVLNFGLGIPIAALRASMESLSDSLPIDRDGHGPLDGLLAEVKQIGKNVRDLMEYASPPDPMPMRCTPREVVLSVRHGLAPAFKDQLTLAFDGNMDSLRTDAPLLARALRRIVESSFDVGSPTVLITVRRQANTTQFCIVEHSPGRRDIERDYKPFHPRTRNRLGLNLAIAARDIELLGGFIETERSPRGEAFAHVTIPDAWIEERKAS